jgi:hypothetical protein
MAVVVATLLLHPEGSIYSLNGVAVTDLDQDR